MKTKARRHLSKSLSIFLALLMVVCAIPMAAIAQTDADVMNEPAVIDSVISDDTLESVTDTAATEEEPYVLGEVENLRTETEKHFRMSDGSYVAVAYGKKVHYQDENEEWQDFDNTLSFVENDTREDFAGYKSSKNDVKINFADDSKSSEFVEIENDDFSISLDLINAKKSKEIKVENTKEKTDSEKPTIEEASELTKFSSSITYTDILENTDIEYIAYGDNLKENIIVKAKSESYVYEFELDTKGLALKLNEDGSISLYDEKTGETEYTIPVGYMFDANGEYSDAVQYTLKQNENNKYTLIVTADASWINEEGRAFPVTVDPTVWRKTYLLNDTNIKDTFVRETPGYTTTNYGDRTYMTVGKISGYEFISLIGINSLPTIPKSSVVIDAQLGLYFNSYIAGQTIKVGAYKVNDNWEESTVTWSTKPIIGSTIIDYQSITTADNKYFNITSIVRDWYAGTSSSTNGIALKGISTTYSTNITTKENTTYNRAFPIFIVSYRDTKGLESRWTYTTHSAGNAGTGYVNDFTGNLVLAHGNISTSDTILPISVSSVFNTYLAGKTFTNTANEIYTSNFSSMKVGLGWKLSVQETICERNLDGEIWFVYNDSDATELYFYDFNDAVSSQGDGIGTYISEDGYGITIAKNTSSTTERYVISDEYGNKKTFNSSGYITYIRDALGNEKSFTYTTLNQLQYIKYKPVGQTTYITQLKFYYNANNALYWIVNYLDSTQQIKFYYSTTYNGSMSMDNAGYLRRIESKFSGNSFYTYNADGTLYEAYDDDLVAEVIYTYSNGNSAITNVSKQVATVTEAVGTGATGQKVGFIYDKMKTSVRSTGNNDIYGDSDDILTTYVFDNEGRTINAYSSNLDGSTIYGVSNAVYEDTNALADGSEKKNTITKDSVAGIPAINYVKNSGAESATYWTQTTTSSSQSTAVTSAYKYSGSYSYNVSSTSTTGYAEFSQYVTIPEGGTYTLSAYVKTNNIVSTSGGGAYLILDDSYTSTTLAGTTSTNIQNGWQRISVTKSFSGGRSCLIQLRVTNASGSAWFDNIQLEKGNAPSSYNIIQNGSFESSDFWYTTAGCTYSSSQKLYSMTGDMATSRYIYQENTVNLPLNTTFVFSGWAMANSVNIQDQRSYDFVVRFNYSDGTQEAHKVECNPDYTGWQFTSEAIVPQKVSTTVIISSITVMCRYELNANTAYFDKISLTIEPAQTYTYNDEGDVISVINKEGNTVSSTYVGSDLTSYTNIVGEKYEYKYLTVGGVNVHLANEVKKSSLSNYTNVVTTTIGYDSYGNVTSSTVSSNTENLDEVSYAAYSYYGNYNSTSTNCNGDTTTYNYNTGKSLLNYVQDANSNRIGYVYDSRERVTTVYLDSDKDAVFDSTEKNIQYTYVNNMLQYILTASTDYSINHDAYGNTTSVVAGDHTITSYTYANYNGKLESVTFGNGLCVSNDYDELDRVIAIKYNGVIKFKFTYNVSGQLYRSTDNANNMVFTYEYDSLKRLIRSTQETTSGTFVMAVQNEYDSLGRASVSKYVFSNKELVYSTQYYQNSSKVSQFSLPGNKINQYTYDGFERLENKAMSGVYTITYTYATYEDFYNGITRTSSQIASMVITTIGGVSTTYAYTYDSVGNILTIKENNVLKQSYTYDALSQLTRENNVYANRTYLYSYDTCANITFKEEYPYTTGAIDYATLIDAKAFNYGANTTWGDLLTNLNGTNITYDASGNPLNWDDVSNLHWQGTKLCGMDFSVDIGVNYSYNSSGIRTSKYLYDCWMGEYTNVAYILDGTYIVKETRTGSQSATLYYYYDESGVTGFEYNGTSYYYGKNLQGDITKIFTAAGVAVVTYTYDAWGNILSTTGSLASTVGAANPFRYRSYYYDTETGWYYLNSRYYDPGVGRFISPDGVLGANGCLTSYNMFAYCNNNPVMFNDPSGFLSDEEIAKAAGVEYIAPPTENEIKSQSETEYGKLDSYPDKPTVDPLIDLDNLEKQLIEYVNDPTNTFGDIYSACQYSVNTIKEAIKKQNFKDADLDMWCQKLKQFEGMANHVSFGICLGTNLYNDFSDQRIPKNKLVYVIGTDMAIDLLGIYGIATVIAILVPETLPAYAVFVISLSANMAYYCLTNPIKEQVREWAYRS